MSQSRLPRHPRRSLAPFVHNMASGVIISSKKRGLSYCSVYGCANTSTKRPEISFFKHPNDVERRKKWLELIGRTELETKPASNYCVCEEHFHVRDIIFGKHRRTLADTALPALNLPRELLPEPEVEPDLPVTIKTEIKTEIDDEIEPEEILPDVTRKRRLESPLPGCSKIVKVEEPVQESKVIVIGSDTFQKLSDKFLSKDLADLTNAEFSLKELLKQKHNKQRNRNVCINLYLSSPDSYHMLKTTLGLPSPKTLNVGPITTHVNNDMMTILSNKVKRMTKQEKECSVLTKIISLKSRLLYSFSEDEILGFQEINGIKTAEPAVKAQVIMVRGIFSDWKQPVGYALLAKDENSIHLNEWIDGILEKLIEIGLNIRTFVSDMGNEFIKAAENRCVTTDKPYFFTGNRKIYYIFEAPNLILMARNHFLLYDFAYEDRIAKYAHVKLFFNKDRCREFKSAPKITKLHIIPTNLDKMNIKYAIELFSNSVATAISNFVTLGIIESSGKDTAEFFALMNNLIDCFSSIDQKGNVSFHGKKSQIDFLNESLAYFQKLKLLRPTNGQHFAGKPKFIEGFQTTIKSALLLFEDLKSEGYTCLPTTRLNLEALNLVVDRIRMKTGMVAEPTCAELVSGFRKSFFANIIKPLKRKVNSKELFDFIAETKKIKQIISNTAVTSKSNEDSSVKLSDFSEVDFPTDSLTQVSHYLLLKCAQAHICAKYPRSLTVTPSDDFVEFVKKMDVSFLDIFGKAFLSKNLAASLSAKLKELPFDQPCPCFPKEYLFNLFVRFRTYNVLKSHKQQFLYHSKTDNKGIIVKCLKDLH